MNLRRASTGSSPWAAPAGSTPSSTPRSSRTSSSRSATWSPPGSRPRRPADGPPALRRRRADQGGAPRQPQRPLDRGLVARPPARCPRPAPRARLLRRRGPDPRPQHRRQHDDVRRGARDPAAAARLRRSRWARRRPARGPLPGRAGQLPRLARPDPLVRGHGRGRDVVPQPRPATGAERVKGLRLTPETLRLLGVAPSRAACSPAGPRRRSCGRRDRPRPVAAAVRRRPPIVGRTMRLDGESYTVVGVMPPHFVFAPFWARVGAVGTASARRPAREPRRQQPAVFARLKPGVGPAAAQADVDLVTARLEAAFPGTNRGVKVVPLKERVVGHTRLGLSVLLVAVGFVLLIACANVAHILLARAATRQSEMAVRLALGATRFQIVRQLLVESLLLSGLSSVVGLALAASACALSRRGAARPAARRRHGGRGLDAGVHARRVAPDRRRLRPGAGLAGGADRIGDRLGARGTPATGAKRSCATSSWSPSWPSRWCCWLAPGSRCAASPRRRRRSGLRATRRALDVRLGAGIVGGRSGRRAAFFPAAVDGCAGCPASRRPARSTMRRSSATSGRAASTSPAARARSDDRPGAVYRVVLPGYFSTMRLPLVRGRDITAADARCRPASWSSAKASSAAIPGRRALGQRMTFDDPTGPAPLADGRRHRPRRGRLHLGSGGDPTI